MKQKKRYATAQLSSEQVRAIETGVMQLADQVLPEGYVLLAADLIQEQGRWILRVTIDRDTTDSVAGGPIGLDDCKRVSEVLSPKLDEQPWLPPSLSYNLEISSPGIFRELTTPREVQHFLNRRVSLACKGQPEEVVILTGFDPATQSLQVQPWSAQPDQDLTVRQLEWHPKTVKLTLIPQEEALQTLAAGTESATDLEGESIL